MSLQGPSLAGTAPCRKRLLAARCHRAGRRQPNEQIRRPDDMSDQAQSQKLSWGILGTGTIAHTFPRALAHSTPGQLVAVASRNPASAEAFGEEFGAPRRYAGYDELLTDP